MLSKAAIEEFYVAEKNAALLVLILGIVLLIVAAICFWSYRAPAGKGIALVCLLVGLLHIITGFSIYKKSDQARIDAVYAYDMNPAKLKSKELVEKSRSVKNIQLFLIVAAVALAAGVFIAIRFKGVGSFYYGVGLALTINALAILIIDYTAYNRNTAYKEKLQHFIDSTR